jgi:hypothetical protein
LFFSHPTQNTVISTEGGALAAAVERPLYFAVILAVAFVLAVASEIGPDFSPDI